MFVKLFLFILYFDEFEMCVLFLIVDCYRIMQMAWSDSRDTNLLIRTAHIGVCEPGKHSGHAK